MRGARIGKSARIARSVQRNQAKEATTASSATTTDVPSTMETARDSAKIAASRCYHQDFVPNVRGEIARTGKNAACAKKSARD